MERTTFSFYQSCQDARGGLYNASESVSWHALSNNSLGLDSSLGYGDLTALYGLDIVTFGFSDSIGGSRLDSQVIATIEPEYYFNGLFGLNHQATNLTNFSDPLPSALTTMKNNNLIPSLSWAYTAGASYSKYEIIASMTFLYDRMRGSENYLVPVRSLRSTMERDMESMVLHCILSKHNIAVLQVSVVF